MTFPGEYEVPSVRLARLLSDLGSTAQSMGDTVSKAVDLEGRSRAMEDNLRRFREVEQRQQPAFRTPIGPSGRTFTTGEITTPEERLALSAPPVSPLPAPGGSGIGDVLSTLPTSPEEAARGIGQRVAGGVAGGVIRRGAEEFETRVAAPSGAAGLQIIESPAGGGFVGVPELKGVQRKLEEMGVPEELSPLPRERTFEEALEGGFVNQFAALIGNKAEQEKAQAVLEEAGLPRALAAEVLFDFTNLFPGMGLTKVDDFARLLRIATKATGAGKARAVKVLAESDLLQQARRGIKAGEAGGRPPPLGGGKEVPLRLPEALAEEAAAVPGWQGVTDRIAAKLNEGAAVFKETKIARSADMRKRTAAALEEARKLRAEGVDPDEIFRQTMKHYEGARPDLLFDEPLRLSADDLVQLGDRSWQYALEETGQYHTARRALLTLKEMVEDRRVPRPHEIKAIRKVFGDSLADSLASIRAGPKGWADWVFEAAVMPKSILSAFDISFPARQGFWTWGMHPVAFADSMRVSAKIWKDPKFADELFERLIGETTVEVGGVQKLIPVTHPRAGVVETPLGEIFEEVGILPKRVEPFLSPMAEKLPGVGRSAQAFTTAGNKLRSDVFRFWIRKWMKNGTELNPERLQNLGDLVNALTGRATFVKGDPWKILQATWWSPQYRLSFPQAVATLFRNLPGVPGADTAIARVAAQELATTFTGTVGILAMLKVSGAADVNLNPLSSDFGKAKIGPQRINFFGTSQLLARSIAQIVKGQRLDPELGIMPTDAGDVALRYFRSGLAPEWGALYDFISGENFLGETLRPSAERGVGGGDIAKREAFNRLLPMAWRDIVEAIRDDGIRGAFIAPAGLVGVSVQSYEPQASQQLQNIPEFTIPLQGGGSADQRTLNQVDEFLGRVNKFRDQLRAEFGSDALANVSTQMLIDEVGRSEGKDAGFIELAKILRFGSSTRKKLTNPEWIQFIVDHADEIRRDRPDLILENNQVIDAIREAGLAR